MSWLLRDYHQWFLWFPVGLGVGIYSFFNWPDNPTILTTGIIIMTTFALFLYLRSKDSFRFLSWGIISLSIGFLAAFIRTESYKHSLIKDKLFNVFLTGSVQKIEPSHHKNKYRLTLHEIGDTDLKLDHIRLNCHYKALPETLQIGDRVQVIAHLTPLPYQVSLNDYNFRFHGYFKKLSAIGRLKKLTLIEKSPLKKIDQIRYAITQKIRTLLPEPINSIGTALTTGERTAIPFKIRDAFAQSGLAHILAISGLHMVLLAGFVFFLIRRILSLIPNFSERYHLKKYSAAFVMVITFAYLILSGLGTPALRAYLMTSLVMMGIILDREAISMHSVALAATVILLLFPESLMGLSFQMSFAAVIALIAFYTAFKNPLKTFFHKNFFTKLIAYFVGISVTSLIANLATLPFSLYTFNQITLNTVAANLMAIPLTGFIIMPLGFLCIISLLLGGNAALFYLWGKSLKGLMSIAQNLSTWEGSKIMIATPHVSFLILFVIGSLWLCLWQQRWRYFGTIPLLLLPLTFIIKTPPTFFISEKLLGYRDGRNLYVSSLRKGRYTRTQWEKEFGLKNAIKFDSMAPVFQKTTLVVSPFVEKMTEVQDKKAYLRTVSQHSDNYLSNAYIKRYCSDAKCVYDKNDLNQYRTMLLNNNLEIMNPINKNRYWNR